MNKQKDDEAKPKLSLIIVLQIRFTPRKEAGYNITINDWAGFIYINDAYILGCMHDTCHAEQSPLLNYSKLSCRLW